MANEKWSQKPLITEISNTTEFCILDEAIPKNKRINAKTLLDTKADSSTLSSHTSDTDNPHSVTKTQVGLGNVDNTSDASKPISTAQQTALDLKAPKENATFTGITNFEGDVQVSEDVIVDGNVRAYSNTVDTRLQFGPDATIRIQTGVNGNTPIYMEFPATELGSHDLKGTNYVTVYGVGTPSENAAELQAAYDAAKTMPRHIGTFSSGDSIEIYKGQTFVNSAIPITHVMVANSNYSGAIALAPIGTFSRIDSQSELDTALARRVSVIIAPGEYNFGTTAFVVDTPYINIVSLTGNSDVIISSTEYAPAFGNYGIKVIADNILVKGIDCKTNAFYIESNLDNLICEYCIGGNYSFGGLGGTASGTFNNCVGGTASFGTDGTASGTFNNCVGKNASFGGGSGGASGAFNNCVGGTGSFGGGASGFLSGELINCKLKSGTFKTPSGEGKIYNCIDGNGTLVNYPPLEASSDLNGSNYLMVYGTGTPEENLAELNAAISEAEKMPRFLGIKLFNDNIQMYAGQTFGIFTGVDYYYYKILENGMYNPFSMPPFLRITETEAKSTSTTIIVAPSIINGTITPVPSGVKIVSLTGLDDVIVNGVKSFRIPDVYNKEQTDALLSRKQDLLNSFNKLGRWNGDINTVYFYLDLVGHLQSANFKTKTISNVTLSNINFKYASFTSSALNNSFFNKSNFSFASFVAATLTNVDLTEANLTKANLSNITLSGVRLDRANLSGATGLDADINIALTPDKYLLSSDSYLTWTDGKQYKVDAATGLLVFAPEINYYYHLTIGEI